MGVTGLWTVVAPTARPTQLATLNRKRLAVDASIWIYQFLKAVRDKEGNALRNSHVVGFFRRICKLLYFGIKPVFVFDGGAPVLKRETIRRRARRREGRREDAARTAGKLLAVQVARAAEEEEEKRKRKRESNITRRGAAEEQRQGEEEIGTTPQQSQSQIEEEEERLPDQSELVYVDELGMSQKERQAGRAFRKKDQYHLPDLDVSIEEMGAPNDPRIMSQAELEEYARQFHRGEDINLYDFNKIDFESPFFLSLPPGDRYNILNAARLRSRLRMGYSKEQLDGMFPDRMAFSRFQIERVKERNELTQRLMHVNGMAEDFLNQGGRIASEKGKEYVLVRNDGVEGGWALGVVSNKQGAKREDAIDLDDEEEARSGTDVDAEEDEEEFEDVAIEGLNRIPQVWRRKQQQQQQQVVINDTSYEAVAKEIARKREEVYGARKRAAMNRGNYRAEAEVLDPSIVIDDDLLFVPQDNSSQIRDAGGGDDDIEELFEDVDIGTLGDEEDDDELQRAIALSLQNPDNDLGSHSGDQGITNLYFQNASKPTTRQSGITTSDGEQRLVIDEDEEMDLQTALSEARRSKHLSKTHVRGRSPKPLSPPSTDRQKFSGPLPFESLNLGQSLLGKKKSKMVEEDLSGGFDRELGGGAFRKEKPLQPLPSWFSATPNTNDLRHTYSVAEDEEISLPKPALDRRRVLQANTRNDVIDLEAQGPEREVIAIDQSSDEEMEQLKPESDVEEEGKTSGQDGDHVDPETTSDILKSEQEARERENRYLMAQEIADENADENLGDQQPQLEHDPHQIRPDKIRYGVPEVMQWDTPKGVSDSLEDIDEEVADWSESDADGKSSGAQGETIVLEFPNRSSIHTENNGDTEQPSLADREPSVHRADDLYHSSQYIIASPPREGVDEEEGRVIQDDEYMSDSDEELMRQFALEVEEHARFASSINNKTSAEATRDYELELKQLRNQQKKDRRDADEVTQVMIQECQALLRLFGLPYITAPMEAEAQCAELVHLGLVDGIVTDDSDIFLFGGTRVYKNMFNAAKFVECYLAADLEKEYALDRKKLIRFAHLLGSDYTEGIPGIGPVTALEILTDFETLDEFKEWCTKVQLGRPQDMETAFRRKFRKTVQKRLLLPTGFPDPRVDQAYLEPEVDSDPQQFQWGVPDLDKLRSYLMATIGWSQERTDEVLVPVIRDMNKRDVEGTQANITRFFAGGVGVGAAVKESHAPRNRTGKESGRMANAFRKLRGEAAKRKGEPSDGQQGQPVMVGDSGASHNDVAAHVDADVDVEIGDADMPRLNKKGARKRPLTESTIVLEDEASDEGDDYVEAKQAAGKRRRRRKQAQPV